MFSRPAANLRMSCHQYDGAFSRDWAPEVVLPTTLHCFEVQQLDGKKCVCAVEDLATCDKWYAALDDACSALARKGSEQSVVSLVVGLPKAGESIPGESGEAQVARADAFIRAGNEGS